MILSFLLALFAMLFFSTFIPSIYLCWFAPFLALTFQRKTLHTSLWLAFMSGIFLDLFTTETRFGFYVLISIFCTLICHRFRHFFFAERLLSLPLYSGLISLLFSLLNIIFHPSFFSIKTFFGSILLSPISNIIYSLVWFTLPLHLYYFKSRYESSHVLQSTSLKLRKK